MNKNRVDLILAAAAAVVIMAVYLPSLFNGFVNIDDHAYVKYNPLIESMGLDFFRTILTEPVVGNWHPLTIFTYGIDYALWERNPFGYHLVNVLFHGLNTALVFLLALRLIGAQGNSGQGRPLLAAIVTAALFGLHPQHVESVSWISERKDVLYAFFFLLSVLSYLRYTWGESRRWYWASLGFFIISLMSKPMAIMLPAVLLILDFYPLGRFGKERAFKIVLEKAPFFAFVPLSAAATLLSKSSGDISSLDVYSLSFRIIVALKSYIFYLYKMVLPINLSAYYPLLLEYGKPDLYAVLSVVLLVIISAFCIIIAFRRRGVYLAVWLYYLASMLPVIGIVQVGGQAAADRYTYLPTLGFLLLAGSGAGLLYNRFERIPGRIGLSATGLLIAAVIIFLNVKQQAIWKSPETLWHGGSKNLAEVYFDRAAIYQNLGNHRKAIGFFNWVITFDPDRADAYTRLGISYAEQGHFDKSMESFSKARDLEPQNPIPYHYISRLYSATGDQRKAVIYWQKARELGYEEGMEE